MCRVDQCEITGRYPIAERQGGRDDESPARRFFHDDAGLMRDARIASLVVPTRAIAFFNLGCHGLTVFGMAVRICQRHGHGEDAKTVPPDSQFEKSDGPVVPTAQTGKVCFQRAS